MSEPTPTAAQIKALQDQIKALQEKQDELQRQNRLLEEKASSSGERAALMERLISTSGKPDYIPGERNVPMPSEKVYEMHGGLDELHKQRLAERGEPDPSKWDPAMALEAGLPQETVDEISRRLKGGEKIEDIKRSIGKHAFSPNVTIVLTPEMARGLLSGEGAPKEPVVDKTFTPTSKPEDETPDPEMEEALAAAAALEPAKTK